MGFGSGGERPAAENFPREMLSILTVLLLIPLASTAAADLP